MSLVPNKVNDLMSRPVYSAVDKQQMRDLLLELEIYTRNQHRAARRNNTQSPRWAWLRKNRGTFDRQPGDPTRDVEIVATGRDQWIGWVELAKEPVDQAGTQIHGGRRTRLCPHPPRF